jgi:hypothetical protein
VTQNDNNFIASDKKFKKKKKKETPWEVIQVNHGLPRLGKVFFFFLNLRA